MALTACSTTGIRGLSQVETDYFANLRTHLADSAGRLDEVLNERTAVNEETALREISILNENIRRAKVVYSVREVLTAPKTDSAAFIQITRNKVILYHLAEAALGENEKLAAELAKGQEERTQLVTGLRNLNKLVSQTIASNEILHNYLNRSGTAQLSDILAEVGRQLAAFNEEIKTADQNNPAVQRLVETGKAAEKRVQQADEGLTKFIDVWSRLNQEKK
jgi:hypothetical protein